MSTAREPELLMFIWQGMDLVSCSVMGSLSLTCSSTWGFSICYAQSVQMQRSAGVVGYFLAGPLGFRATVVTTLLLTGSSQVDRERRRACLFLLPCRGAGLLFCSS